MDVIYSLSLLISLIASGLGATIFALVAVKPDQAQRFGPGLALAALVCGATALLFGMISVFVHLVFGHGSDSVATMTTSQFFWHHKAYWFVLPLTLLAYGAWRSAGRYRDQNRRTD